MLALTVVGVDGKIIKQINQEVLTGTTIIDLELPELSNGVYFLRTTLGNTSELPRPKGTGHQNHPKKEF